MYAAALKAQASTSNDAMYGKSRRKARGKQGFSARGGLPDVFVSNFPIDHQPFFLSSSEISLVWRPELHRASCKMKSAGLVGVCALLLAADLASAEGAACIVDLDAFNAFVASALTFSK